MRPTPESSLAPYATDTRSRNYHRICPQLDLGLLSVQTVRSKHLLFKPPSLCYFVAAAWTKYITKIQLPPKISKVNPGLLVAGLQGLFTVNSCTGWSNQSYNVTTLRRGREGNMWVNEATREILIFIDNARNEGEKVAAIFKCSL